MNEIDFWSVPLAVMQRALTKHHPEGECWVTDYSTARSGYGQLGWRHQGKTRMIFHHRAMWFLTHGSIPDAMTVDHLCYNRACVRPEHLRLLSRFENSRRTGGRDWRLGVCANGHPNDLMAVVNSRTGKRNCRECAREANRRYRARKMAAAA